MSDFYIQYNYCPREDNGRGGFIFNKKEVREIGPILENEVELKAIDLMSDANTIPQSVRVFEKKTKSIEEVVQEISETLLGEQDGDRLQTLANDILTHEVEYIGDSMFSQMIDVTQKML